MAFLLGGAKESARANAIMVGVKIAALILFCAVAFTGIRAGNYTPFMPLGMAGVSAAGATLFFSYIGFDAASTAGEEAKNPQRDLPRAIMLSLVIVTALYCLVAAVAVGALPWKKFSGTEAALAGIMENVTGQSFWAVVLAAGAVIAIASVVLTVLYGQTRILFAMSRDGLVPPVFSKVHPKTGVPRANTVIVSLFCGVLAAAIPLGQLADATSIGTLFAFALVNIAVIVLRRTRPDMTRTFRVPLSPLFPLVGFGLCLWMMNSLEPSPGWSSVSGWPSGLCCTSHTACADPDWPQQRSDSPAVRLNDLDERIVHALAEDARRSYADIGELVGLSAPAVKRRVDRLRADGAITGFTVRVDPAALGWETEGFVEIYCRRNTSPGDHPAGPVALPGGRVRVDRHRRRGRGRPGLRRRHAPLRAGAGADRRASRSWSGPSRCWCCRRCCGATPRAPPRRRPRAVPRGRSGCRRSGPGAMNRRDEAAAQ